MLIVGLTGNIGSGKSTVAAVFKCLNIPVYHADIEAKKMYLRRDVLKKTVLLTGEQILDADGHLNTRALATIAFADPEILASLNQIIHPLVMEDFRIWITQQTEYPYVIHEAAIIFESGLGDAFNKVIHVSCPARISIERIAGKDSISREMILRRMRFQLPDAQKSSRSDFVILNDGSTLIIPQILEIHRTLSKGSA